MEEICNQDHRTMRPLPKTLRFTSGDVNIEERGLNPMKIAHFVDCSSRHRQKHANLSKKTGFKLSRSEDDPDIILVESQKELNEDDFQNQQHDVIEKIQIELEDIHIKTTQFDEAKLPFVKSKMKTFLSDNSIGQTLIGYYDEENKMIHLIGLKLDLDEAINNLLKDMETEDVIEECLNLKPDETTLLKLANFENEIRKVNEDIQWEFHESGIRITGLEEDVNAVELKKQMMLSKYNLLVIRVPERCFIQRQDVQNYIRKRLEDDPKSKECKLIVEGDAIKAVVVRSKEQACKDIIEKCIREERVKLNSHEKKRVFKGEKWIKQNKILDSEFKQKYVVNISEGEGICHLLCTDDIHLQIMANITEFRKKNALREKTVPCSPTKFQFLQVNGEDEIFESEYIDMQFGENGLKVKATETGISWIIHKLKQLKIQRFGILSNGLITYLSSNAGRTEMENLGRTSNCLFRLKENVDVKVIKALIEEQKADVLVNSVSHDLVLDVGQPKVATSMLLKGGNNLQAELKAKYPQGIKDWDVAYCGSGNLQCTEVFNCCLPQSSGLSSNKQEFKKVVLRCLEKADDTGYKTMVFPALGTGYLKYTPDIVADLMFSVISEFIRKRENLSLKKIGIAILPKNTQVIQAFENAFNTWCPKETSATKGILFRPDKPGQREKMCIYEFQLEVMSDLENVSHVLAEIEDKFKQQNAAEK